MEPKTQCPARPIWAHCPRLDRSSGMNKNKLEESALEQLQQTLEERVAERTAQLVKANEQLRKEIQERTRAEALLRESESRARTLVENAPEAIVVFDGVTGRFEECNPNAVKLYGLSREELIGRHPAELSPMFQPDGRASLESTREKIQQALDGQTPVFEWMHRHSSGRLVPCEVRLVRLHAEGKHLIRGSVIDNTDRRRRERVHDDGRRAVTSRLEESARAPRPAGGCGTRHREPPARRSARRSTVNPTHDGAPPRRQRWRRPAAPR